MISVREWLMSNARSQIGGPPACPSLEKSGPKEAQKQFYAVRTPRWRMKTLIHLQVFGTVHIYFYSGARHFVALSCLDMLLLLAIFPSIDLQPGRRMIGRALDHEGVLGPTVGA